MEKYLLAEIDVFDGVQKVYKFENGYGASVVRHSFSYGGSSGMWEMALITFEEQKELEWEIEYREDFADGDVAGYLNDKDVLELLNWIRSL